MNLKFLFILSIFLTSFIVIPSNSHLYDQKTDDFKKFSLSPANQGIKIFQANNSFWYRITLTLNITTLMNDNVTLEYSAGGDVIILHVIDTPRNFTMKIFSPFITLEFFNKSSTGIAEGFYKLSLGKRTLYPGMYHSLLEFIYKVALFTMKDFGIPEPIGRLIFISTFIVITILFIYFLYKLRQKIGKKIRINPQLNYY